MSTQKILEAIDKGKSFEFGNVFTETFELFKKTWFYGFLMQLITVIILIALLVTIYVPFLSLILAQTQQGNNSDLDLDNFYASLTPMYIGYAIISGVVLITLTMAIRAAFYKMIPKLDAQEEVSVGDFFYFFKWDYLVKLFLILLCCIGIVIIATLFFIIPVIYVSVPLTYLLFVFAFNPELSIGDLLKVSFKIGTKYWFVSFLLIIVYSIIAQIIGFLICGVGLLVLASIVYNPIYLIYRDVIGFQKTSKNG